MWRVTAMIKAKEGLSPQSFQDRWQNELAPAIAKAARSDPRLRRLVLNIPASMNEDVGKLFPPAFDGMVEFWFDTPEDAVAVMRSLSQDDGLTALGAEIVDGGNGVAWLSREVPTKLEDGSRVKFTAGGDIIDTMTLDEAQRYYAEVHPALAKTVPQVWGQLTRYTQFHGKPEPALEMGDWLAKARFVPLCSDMGFARQEDFISLYTSNEYATIVRPDEQNFSKPGEALTFVTSEERELVG